MFSNLWSNNIFCDKFDINSCLMLKTFFYYPKLAQTASPPFTINIKQFFSIFLFLIRAVCCKQSWTIILSDYNGYWYASMYMDTSTWNECNNTCDLHEQIRYINKLNSFFFRLHTKQISTVSSFYEHFLVIFLTPTNVQYHVNS